MQDHMHVAIAVYNTLSGMSTLMKCYTKQKRKEYFQIGSMFLHLQLNCTINLEWCAQLIGQTN